MANLTSFRLDHSNEYSAINYEIEWQWMFVVEALPAVLLGVVTIVWLTDKPAIAAWLPAQERDWLVARIGRRRVAIRISPYG